MGARIIVLLEYIDGKKLGDIDADDIRLGFKEEVVSESLNSGFIEFYVSGNRNLCRLTQAGHNFLLQDRTRRQANSSNKWALIVAIIAVIIAIIALFFGKL
jgi:hypothetical protein